ncbi:hypothetical protein Tco_0805010 [Tanacetum coccineum]
MKVEESLNVTFDETPPPSKTSPLEDDDLVEEEAIKVSKTRPLGNNLEDKSLENNEIIYIKESKSHQLENVIGNLEEATTIRKSIALLRYAIGSSLGETQEQQNLNLQMVTQPQVVWELEVIDKQLVELLMEQLRFNDSFETKMHVMVEWMND